MKATTLEILDEVNVHFHGLDAVTRRKMVEALRYFVPHAKHTPAYKLGRWDGYVSYATLAGVTQLNFLDRILPIVIDAGYEITVDDKRQKFDFEFDTIHEEYFAELGKVWPKGHPAEGQPVVLRDYQVEIINNYLKEKQALQEISTSAGKCQPYSSQVLTPTGWTTMGELKTGDSVMTPKGHAAKILAVYEPGEKDVYEITFEDGRTVRSCKDHIWPVARIDWKNTNKGFFRNLTTEQIISEMDKLNRSAHPRKIGVKLASMENDTSDIDLPIHPWLMGFLLGDGSFRNTLTFSTADNEIVNKVKSFLHEDYELSKCGDDNYDYRIVIKGEHRTDRKRKYLQTHNRYVKSENPNGFHMYNSILRNLGLFDKRSHEKFIPDVYFRGSLSQRIELIRGLVDSVGYIDHGSVTFTSTSKQLAEGFQRLVHSVGGVAKLIHHSEQVYTNTHGVTMPCKDSWDVRTKFRDPQALVSLERKREKAYKHVKTPYLRLNIIDIKKVSTEPVRCIYIDDPDHLYLTDGYVVTHNTIITAALSAMVEKYGRSLVIVPSKSLVTQTAADYANLGLDVGVYYGERKELGHKHTISTWQSLERLFKSGKESVITDDLVCVMVDEAHGVQGNTLRSLLCGDLANIPLRFGLTGTIPKEEYNAMALLGSIGPVIHKLAAKELQDKGVLSQCQINIIQTEETAEYVGYQAEHKYLTSDPKRIRWLADGISTISESGNTLVLVDRVETGEEITEYLKSLDKDVTFVSGKMNVKARSKEYDEVSSSANKIIVATYGVAAVGINIPRIFNLVMLEPGKSFVRVIQSIGRGIRKAQDKDFVLIWDVCANSKYSKRHTAKRKQFYNDAQYPHKTYKMDITKTPMSSIMVG